MTKLKAASHAAVFTQGISRKGGTQDKPAKKRTPTVPFPKLGGGHGATPQYETCLICSFCDHCDPTPSVSGSTSQRWCRCGIGRVMYYVAPGSGNHTCPGSVYTQARSMSPPQQPFAQQRQVTYPPIQGSVSDYSVTAPSYIPLQQASTWHAPSPYSPQMDPQAAAGASRQWSQSPRTPPQSFALPPSRGDTGFGEANDYYSSHPYAASHSPTSTAGYPTSSPQNFRQISRETYSRNDSTVEEPEPYYHQPQQGSPLSVGDYDYRSQEGSPARCIRCGGRLDE